MSTEECGTDPYLYIILGLVAVGLLLVIYGVIMYSTSHSDSSAGKGVEVEMNKKREVGAYSGGFDAGGFTSVNTFWLVCRYSPDFYIDVKNYGRLF